MRRRAPAVAAVASGGAGTVGDGDRGAVASGFAENSEAYLEQGRQIEEWEAQQPSSPEYNAVDDDELTDPMIDDTAPNAPPPAGSPEEAEAPAAPTGEGFADNSEEHLEQGRLLEEWEAQRASSPEYAGDEPTEPAMNDATGSPDEAEVPAREAGAAVPGATGTGFAEGTDDHLDQGRRLEELERLSPEYISLDDEDPDEAREILRMRKALRAAPAQPASAPASPAAAYTIEAGSTEDEETVPFCENMEAYVEQGRELEALEAQRASSHERSEEGREEAPEDGVAPIEEMEEKEEVEEVDAEKEDEDGAALFEAEKEEKDDEEDDDPEHGVGEVREEYDQRRYEQERGPDNNEDDRFYHVVFEMGIDEADGHPSGARVSSSVNASSGPPTEPSTTTTAAASGSDAVDDGVASETGEAGETKSAGVIKLEETLGPAGDEQWQEAMSDEMLDELLNGFEGDDSLVAILDKEEKEDAKEAKKKPIVIVDLDEEESDDEDACVIIDPNEGEGEKIDEPIQEEAKDKSEDEKKATEQKEVEDPIASSEKGQIEVKEGNGEEVDPLADPAEVISDETPCMNTDEEKNEGGEGPEDEKSEDDEESVEDKEEEKESGGELEEDEQEEEVEEEQQSGDERERAEDGDDSHQVEGGIPALIREARILVKSSKEHYEDEDEEKSEDVDEESGEENGSKEDGGDVNRDDRIPSLIRAATLLVESFKEYEEEDEREGEEDVSKQEMMKRLRSIAKKEKVRRKAFNRALGVSDSESDGEIREEQSGEDSDEIPEDEEDQEDREEAYDDVADLTMEGENGYLESRELAEAANPDDDDPRKSSSSESDETDSEDEEAARRKMEKKRREQERYASSQRVPVNNRLRFDSDSDEDEEEDGDNEEVNTLDEQIGEDGEDQIPEDEEHHEVGDASYADRNEDGGSDSVDDEEDRTIHAMHRGDDGRLTPCGSPIEERGDEERKAVDTLRSRGQSHLYQPHPTARAPPRDVLHRIARAPTRR